MPFRPSLARSSPQRTVCAFVDVDDGRLLSCIAFPPPERGPAAVLSVAAVSGDIRSQADLLRQSATASGHGRGVNFVLTVEGVPVWRGCATVWLLEDGSLRSKVDGDLQGTLVQPARCRHAAVEVGCSEEAGRGRAGQAGQRGTSGMRCVLLSTGAHVHTVSRLRVDTAKKQGRVPGVRAKLLHCAAGAWEACAAFEDGTVTVVHF